MKLFAGVSRAAILGAVLATLVALVPVFQLRPVYLRQSVGVGQAAFEPSPTGVILRYGDRTSEMLYPSLTPVEGDALLVAPGATLVLPVTADPTSFRGVDPEIAPWIVLGEEGPDTASRMSKEPIPQGHRLVGGTVLAIVDGSLRLVPWDASAPWHVDRQRLAEVRSRCGDHVLHVAPAEGQLDFRIGHCRLPIPAGKTLGSLRLAVTGDAVVTRAGVGWPLRHTLLPPLVLIVLLLMAAQVLAYGIHATGVIGLACAIASLRYQEASSFAWMAAGVIGEGVVLVQLALAAWGRASRARTMPRAAVLLLSAATLFAVMDVAYLHPHGVNRLGRNREAVCLVIGYSTAGNASLPDESYGFSNTLDAECPACAGETGTLTESAQTFGWVRYSLCSERLPPEIKDVFFLGGANDDLLQTQSRLQAAVMQILLTVHFALTPPTQFQAWVDRWAGAFERVGEQRLKESTQQADQIASTVACTKARHQSFYYIHDFLVTDLYQGRGANRQRLLERRRAAVEAAGGTFVNLYDVFGAEAGVSWFNDFIHPSAVGHQAIARYVCGLLARGGSPNPAR